VGIGISTLGVVLVVVSAPSNGNARHPMLGAVLMALAVLLWAFYTILAKRASGSDQLLVTAMSQVFGMLALLPLAAVEWARAPHAAITGGDWMGILYLGAISSAAGYLLYNWSLRHMDASRVGNFTNLMPIVGVTVAMVFLGERMAPLQFVGGVGVLIGVWLSSSAADRRDPV